MHGNHGDVPMPVAAPTDIVPGKWAIFKYKLAKTNVKHFIGQVMSVDKSDKITVSFLKSKEHGKFVWPEKEDIDIIQM